MNRYEFMSELRLALSVLPDEERANALRYYEEYFDDAGPGNDQEAAASLGDPHKIAQQILSEYQEITTVPQPDGSFTAETKKQRRWRGINPWLLLLLVLLATPIGIPLAGALLTLVIVCIFVIIAIPVVAVAIPLSLIAAGGIFVVLSFAGWRHPASALVTLGCGLAALALGVLTGLLVIKLAVRFVPPLFRGFVAILRRPFDRVRKGEEKGKAKEKGGKS